MNYIDYYPSVLQEVLEIQIISEVLDKYLNRLESDREALINELYLSTAESVGLERWESILGIDVVDSSTEARRLKIRSKLLGDRTTLRTKLDALLGSGNYTIEVDCIKCHVTIQIRSAVSNAKSAVAEMLEKVLPLNLTYEIGLLYNTHKTLSGYTHKELSGYTFAELRAKKLGV